MTDRVFEDARSWEVPGASGGCKAVKTVADVIKILTSARTRVLNGAATCKEYKEYWGPDYTLKELSRCFSPKKSLGYNEIPVLTLADLRQVPFDALTTFGFAQWDQDGLVLYPLWVVGFLEPNTPVISITGKATTLAECDKDVHGGCIAFGFYHK